MYQPVVSQLTFTRQQTVGMKGYAYQTLTGSYCFLNSAGYYLCERVGPSEAGTHDSGVASSKQSCEWPQRNGMLVNQGTYQCCADDNCSYAGS